MAEVDDLLKEAVKLILQSKGGVLSPKTAARTLPIYVNELRKKKGEAAAIDYLKDTIMAYRAGLFPLN